MAVSKQFLTFTQQIDYLRNEKGITIANKQSAEDVLQRIGYFALMGGYKELFRIPFSKKYKKSSPDRTALCKQCFCISVHLPERFGP